MAVIPKEPRTPKIKKRKSPVVSNEPWTPAIKSTKGPEVEFYKVKGKAPVWRWRLRYSGHIVASSSERFHTKITAKKRFKKIEELIRYLRKNNKI